MNPSYIVFGPRRETSRNVIFIDPEKGDYTSLQKCLESKGHSPYEFAKNHLNIKYFQEGDVFISYVHDNTIELRLEQFLIPREGNVIIAMDGEELDQVIKERDRFLVEDYQIFSGAKIGKRSKEEKVLILELMVLMSRVLYQMLDAGYMELENLDRIDDWIITFQEPVLDLLIRYHQMMTSAADVETSQEFLINPRYRREICIILMKVLSNFVVNNGMLKMEDIRGYDNWEDRDLWEELRTKVRIFRV